MATPLPMKLTFQGETLLATTNDTCGPLAPAHPVGPPPGLPAPSSPPGLQAQGSALLARRQGGRNDVLRARGLHHVQTSPPAPAGSLSTPHTPQTPWSPPSGGSRWWHDAPPSLTCPVAQLPIRLAEVEPFKFRVRPSSGKPTVMTDARMLALRMLEHPDAEVCGRKCDASDAQALDKHLKRIGLGRFCVSEIFELRRRLQAGEDIAMAETIALLEERRTQASVAFAELLCAYEQRFEAWKGQVESGAVTPKEVWSPKTYPKKSADKPAASDSRGLQVQRQQQQQSPDPQILPAIALATALLAASAHTPAEAVLARGSQGCREDMLALASRDGLTIGL